MIIRVEMNATVHSTLYITQIHCFRILPDILVCHLLHALSASQTFYVKKTKSYFLVLLLSDNVVARHVFLTVWKRQMQVTKDKG